MSPIIVLFLEIDNNHHALIGKYFLLTIVLFCLSFNENTEINYFSTNKNNVFEQWRSVFFRTVYIYIIKQNGIRNNRRSFWFL